MATATKPLPKWVYLLLLGVFVVPGWLAVLLGASRLISALTHGQQSHAMPMLLAFNAMAAAGIFVVSQCLLRRPKDGPLPSRRERWALWAGVVAISAPLLNFALTQGRAGSVIGVVAVLWPLPAYLLILFEQHIAPERQG